MRYTVLLCLLLVVGAIKGQSDSIAERLDLSELIVTDFTSRSLLGSGLSLSVIKRPADQSLQGVADLVSRVPGMFVDASVGEAFTRVYSRGVSLSAEDDIGWYYTSLQEDGLPVTLVQYQQFSPDFFVRPHLGMTKTEVLRGGKSSILAPNSPGGIINFITNKDIKDSPLHVRLTGGQYAGGRGYGRIEGHTSQLLEEKGLAIDLSFLYRYDQGPRYNDYPINRGGQFQLGVSKKLNNGVLRFSLKNILDNVNRYTGVPATDWSNPRPAFGFSFQNGSLLPPVIPGSDFDPSRGIGVDESAVRVDYDATFGEWRLTNKTKASFKRLNWNTAIGGQPIGLENFISYFISGDPFPAGIIEFNGGDVIVNNSGAFGVFQGVFPPTFEYIKGSLPNDAIMGTGLWQKEDRITDFMNELRLSRSFENVQTTSGLFVGQGNASISTKASFYYATYEPNPKPLSVTLRNPGQPARFLSTPQGVSNIHGLFYEGADINYAYRSVFTDVSILLLDQLRWDVGVRWEMMRHKGTKDRFGRRTLNQGGLDGDVFTTYDNGPLGKTGEDTIDFRYGYLSYSTAFNYTLGDALELYFRNSLGRKAPELNFYINNFSNQSINEKPLVQDVLQTELGMKYPFKGGALAATLFRSILKNVAFVDFVFDDRNNQIFYTPTLFNETSTIGIELESELTLTDHLVWHGSLTLQRAHLEKYSLYDAAGTIETDDDEIIDFSGSRVPHNPDIMFRTGLVYSMNRWHSGVHYQYMGARFGNFQNAFTLPAYGVVSADLSFAVSHKLSLGLRGRNLFNSDGLANFFGPNTFGGTSNAADAAYIAANPNGSFTVFPIMPRALYLSVDYQF